LEPPPTQSPPPAQSPPVHEELSTVHRAQQALASGDPKQALELMDGLSDGKPGGSLLVERELTRVLALCALGREAEARAVAERVLELPGGAAYQARLARSCARNPSKD
jgi:hypothetical protein